jgi:hypothetical protein
VPKIQNFPNTYLLRVWDTTTVLGYDWFVGDWGLTAEMLWLKFRIPM